MVSIYLIDDHAKKGDQLIREFLIMILLQVHYMFTVCSLWVHSMFTLCAPYVHHIFTIYSPYIHCILSSFLSCVTPLNKRHQYTVKFMQDEPKYCQRQAYSWYVHYGFTICLQYVYYMYTICSLHIHHIFTAYSLAF